jgi:multiple sugar transport system substrate-binding protein
MEEITLSVMRNTDQTELALRRVLDAFEAQHRVHVNLQMLLWPEARQQVKQYALHQHGPDVSVMATTWVADLIAMNALQPLKEPLTGAALCRPEDFIAAAWDTTLDAGREQSYAAPWLVDTYVIHYRRDLLAKAGLDPARAFASLEQIDKTVRALSQAGAPVPIQLPYAYDRFCTLHTLAAWVWGRGGEFCTADGKRVLFDQPEALEGIRAFFRLARHLSPAAREQVAGSQSGSLFRDGRAALAFGTLSFQYDPETIQPEVLDQWGVAPLPGPHFVGGVNLVAWRYSLRRQASLDLIRYLNRPDVALHCAQAMLTSPAQLAVLEGPAYSGDPTLSVISASARSGRSYPPVPLWGLIEDRLTETLAAVGEKALATGHADDMLVKAIQATAKRLNITLESL